eukprot:758346-Alexandrium_andersonii.AAC.1
MAAASRHSCRSSFGRRHSSWVFILSVACAPGIRVGDTPICPPPGGRSSLRDGETGDSPARLLGART